MKNLLFVTILSLSFSLSSFADIIYPDGSAPSAVPYEVKKFARSWNNIGGFVLEIPKSVFDATAEYGVLSSEQFSYGLIRGYYKAGLRLASGFYDLGTFLEPNERLVHLEPEFIGDVDALPGLKSMFNWETIETGAGTDR